MMKLSKKILLKNIFLMVTFASFLFISCKEEEPEEVYEDAFELQVQDSTEADPFNCQAQQWHPTNKKICVIFGYDFNTPEITENLTSLLEENFGLVDEDGLIYTITYPNDFKHPKSYVSELTSMLTEAEGDLIGVIILGAPDNTHYAFGRLQDFWNMKTPYPVFALFPQDESLGLESTTDFVLDKFISAGLTGEIVDEDTEQIIKEAPQVLISTVKYMKDLNGAFAKNNSVQNHITQMYKGYKLQYYTDPETGLHAINHFILY